MWSSFAMQVVQHDCQRHATNKSALQGVVGIKLPSNEKPHGAKGASRPNGADVIKDAPYLNATLLPLRAARPVPPGS
jgi:hypothetical protein